MPGSRKRRKLRWLSRADSSQRHAFHIGDGGVLADLSLCGLPLQLSEMALSEKPKCEACSYSHRRNYR